MAAPASPTNGHLYVVDANTVRVTWDPPSGGPWKFRVYARLSGSSSDYEMRETGYGVAEQYLQGLTAGSDWDVLVTTYDPTRATGSLETAAPVLSGTPSLTTVDMHSSALTQFAIEALIDGLWVNRAALGAAGCSINVSSNPGSAGAASTRASKITDLETAGCTVTI